MKIIIGSGGIKYEGWISTDIDTLDILDANDWEKICDGHKIDNLLAEHVLEHLTMEETRKVLYLAYIHMEKNGVFRVAVPDGFHVDRSYVEMVKPGGWGAGSEDHKILYNYRTLCELFIESGFDVKLIEYFDEAGNFHQNEMDKELGLIRRSREHDHRNTKEKLIYTSLILDAVKVENS